MTYHSVSFIGIFSFHLQISVQAKMTLTKSKGWMSTIVLDCELDL